MSLELRAREIAEFLGIPEADAVAKLSRGFGALHAEVNDEFRRCNPQTDEELLEWYRTTESYIWELTAYHLDPGFNYSEMCHGIATKLFLNLPKRGRVLCLGDGIGDLSLCMYGYALEPTYHDLAGSRTAEFAKFRAKKQRPKWDLSAHCTGQWNPEVLVVPNKYDAVVSLDFMEHVTDVLAWAQVIYEALKPGGLFCAQNAFDCGSGPDGGIPMHLTRNDKYAHAAPETNGLALWDYMLFGIGFQQIGSNWYRRPA